MSVETSESAPTSTTAERLDGVTHWRWSEVLPPIVLLVIATYAAALISPGMKFMMEGALGTLVMVLALQVFVGNSGVLSFGHGAFALLGGLTAGMLTMPSRIKENTMSDLVGFLQNAHTSVPVALVAAIVIATIVGLVVGVFLMRLHGLTAGIATFAVLMVADNIFFNSRSIGPGPQIMPQIPKFEFLELPMALAIVALVIAYAAGVSRWGRLLRASREDLLAAQALGSSVWKLRVAFFTLSAGLAGLAGAMYAHRSAAVSVRDFYLDFTFLTFSMLIIGGAGSVWGAVVGCALITALSQFLLQMESGLQVGNLVFTLPDGVRSLILAAVLVVVLLWRPKGITGGREFRIRRAKATPATNAPD